MAMRSHYCGLVTEALTGQTVSLCGWVNRRRDHGGVIFIDLRDREGYVQVVCDPDRPDMFKASDCIELQMSVDEALTYVISMGVVSPGNTPPKKLS